MSKKRAAGRRVQVDERIRGEGTMATETEAPPPIDPRAGQPAQPSMLVDVPRLMTAYYTRRPDAAVRAERVAFGTSGHRGSAFDSAFNEGHILAITQAICEHR